MNQIMITGNIGDVHLKVGKSGKEYAVFSIMHARRNPDKTYTRGFLNMKAFGEVAKRLSKFKKGSALDIIASFRFGAYNDEEGKTRSTVDYVVNSFNLAGSGAYIARKEVKDTTAPNTSVATK